ncbi:Clavaminate synthase-like protein [Colletotrichum sp. SAR 10_99]|nr:Clavaminate synthase-like protein [Colletotrichum sp. SAR 10_96]KAJ5017966.1 Clavaminate synthase-like protein [Colletotrichum sp. SAR 10_99]
MSNISTENFDEKPAATMAIEFETFEVPGARTYFGNTLPYGLQVKQIGAATPAVEDTAAALRELGDSGKLQELLERHGAVLVRGAGHPSADTFAKLVGAAEEGRGSRPHVQIGLAGKRTPLADNAYAVQYSRYTRFPSNIHFYCVKKAPKGGATPIANSANVFEKVQAEIPELVEQVHKRGLGMKMVFRAPGNEAKVNSFNWAGKHSFGQELVPGDDEATTRQKVEKQVNFMKLRASLAAADTHRHLETASKW